MRDLRPVTFIYIFSVSPHCVSTPYLIHPHLPRLLFLLPITASHLDRWLVDELLWFFLVLLRQVHLFCARLSLAFLSNSPVQYRISQIV